MEKPVNSLLVNQRVCYLLRSVSRFHLHLLDALGKIIEHLFLIHKWLPINAIWIYRMK